MKADNILQTIYTPSQEEILLADQYTKDPQNKLKFLILLKSNIYKKMTIFTLANIKLIELKFLKFSLFENVIDKCCRSNYA